MIKTLIINSSPRKNGDSHALIAEFKKHMGGDIAEISAYYDNINPCIDCRKCWKKKGCVINDDMMKIYKGDYNILVIASPVYMSGLTGPIVSLASRFQVYYAARRFLHEKIEAKKKDGVLLLVGGGDGDCHGAVKMAEWIFKETAAEYSGENAVFSLNTDSLPARDDHEAMEKVKLLAERLKEKYAPYS